LGERDIPFSRTLWIEQADFTETPPKKWFRLAPGSMVRLKSAYIIRCDEVVKDERGQVTEIHCTHFPESKSGQDTSGLSVKGTIHWVSAAHAIPVEVRLYDRLFKVENPAQEDLPFQELLNPDSLQIISPAMAEPSLKMATQQDRFQFLRNGYFCLDKDSTSEHLIFNRTATLKDTWSKVKN
jgi:glutaminyl-tRNA synthetase